MTPTVITSAAAFTAALEAERATGRTVGLVPTMGALHAGHQSLVARAARECDVVAVTVFVNPLQFNDAADLAAYPSQLEDDVSLVGAAGASIVFAPPVAEMYPGYPVPPATTVRVDGLTDCLEGASRPGHFDGVTTVVAKLFALAGRCRAYFGDKDFQQLAVVRRMTTDLMLPVEIVGCAIVRDADGLALSSRNVRLTPPARAAALVLRRALDGAMAAVAAGERDPHVLESLMAATLDAQSMVTRDYAVAVEADTLAVPPHLHGEVRLLVAAVVDGVRLIDNDGVVLDAVAPDLALTSARKER